MYERQNGSDMEVGSYAHRAILMSPDDIPSIEESALSPTELPFTSEDFDPQLEQALELMPEILTVEGAGIRHAINGLLSLTPDGMPILGETPEVKGLWSVAAVWIKEGAGIARAVAEWATDGASEIDVHGADVARFWPHQRAQRHVDARSAEGYNKTYGIVHPMEQWASNRGVRLSPFHAREEALGAVFYETAGWERPWWYESNAPLVEEYGERVMPREAEWESRWWSPIINAEHLAMRDRVAMIDLTAFAIFDVVGPGSLEYLQGVALAECDVPPGRVIYTPILNGHGGFKTDLTIMRLGDTHFRIVTGGADGPRDFKWFHDHLPADGSASLLDVTSNWCTVGVWGPRARDLLSSVTSDDVSHEGFPFVRCRELEVGPVRVLASRISYVGDLGWELYAPMESGRALWDVLWEAGQPLGLVPAGIGVYGTTGRIEKGYRLFGAELESEYDVVEAGMQRPSVKEAEFVGKDAYVRARDEEPAAVLCTLTVDDHTSASGVKRYMLGREPILTPGGERIVDRKGRGSYVTTAGSGPSVGKHLLLAYLPPEHAVEGGKLLVEYMGERYPVTVEVVGSRPLFDPENARIRAVKVARLRQARARDGGADLPDSGRAGRSTTLPRATRSARTRSARSRRRCGSRRGTAARRRCSRWGRRRRRSSCGTRSRWVSMRRSCSRPTARTGTPQATAAAIADAVRERGFDLLLFGNESADSGGYQVGIRVAYLLGLPVVTGAKGIELADGRATVRREAGAGWEIFETPLPAVVTVREGINLPRYPSLPGRLKAKKTELQTSAPVRRDGGLTKVRLSVPQDESTPVVVLGEGAAAAPRVVEVLQELGVA